MSLTKTLDRRVWSAAAVAFAVIYGLLRWYWAAGGRWGYTACDRTTSPPPAELATGCDAEQLATLPVWEGWAAVALCGALAAVGVIATLRTGRAISVVAWVACVALVVLSFPGHLLFELPAAASGRPSDWRDLGNRIVLLVGGLLWAATAAAVAPRRCGHPRSAGPRPVPAWLRRCSYVGCALPVLGFTVPHAFWFVGIPLGIPADVLGEVAQNITAPVGITLTVVPAAGGLLTLGLGHRWGQVFPWWTGPLAGHRVPRLVALLPAGVAAVALTSYGLIGIVLITEALAVGETTWEELVNAWAVTGTELVFLGWGVALVAATIGYHQVTRPRCPVCAPPDDASGRPLAGQPTDRQANEALIGF